MESSDEEGDSEDDEEDEEVIHCINEKQVNKNIKLPSNTSVDDNFIESDKSFLVKRKFQDSHTSGENVAKRQKTVLE